MPADYDDPEKTRQRLYELTKAELVIKQNTNATNYDTAILTLSSAFLALSIAVIKDVVGPLSEANWLCLLYFSWGSYCAAIVSTVVSFMVGQSGYRRLIEAAERYYIKQEEEAYQVSITVAKRIEVINILNGFFFIIATVLMVAFTICNFNRIASMPSGKTATPMRGYPYRHFTCLAKRGHSDFFY